MGGIPRRHAADPDRGRSRRLRSLNDPVNLDEVRRIYLSIVAAALSAHVESSQLLFEQRKRFLNLSMKASRRRSSSGSPVLSRSASPPRRAYLKELLARWPSSPKVDLVTTDGFLYPNEVLRRENLMDRKGFPESYDVGAVLRFLSEIKAGEHSVRAPLLFAPDLRRAARRSVTIDRPDILIFEGINVLQVRDLPEDGKIVPFVSDFFDFSIYIDADEDDIHKWYVDRFMNLRQTAFRDPESFFHRYAAIKSKTPLAPLPRAFGRTST
jgi:type I pantothenate kinase